MAVLNAGSATAKAALVDVTDRATRVHWRGARALPPGADAAETFDALLRESGVDERDVDAVGHRVVHGGTRFVGPARIDSDVESEIASLTRLAPLHHPACLAGVAAARARFPDRPMVAVFDTGFHAGRAARSMRYALPSELCDELGLLRYGFHGIAHASLLAQLSQSRRTPRTQTDAVTLQLGAGCSACAIERGRSIETSMGFSTLGGLPMATRAGDLDPGIPLELLRQGYDVKEVETLLTRRSGLLGMAGSADLREVLEAESRGQPRARTAVSHFVSRVVECVGAYLTLLSGRGSLVFGGGIGTHSADIRDRVCRALSVWDVSIDPARNATPGISGPISRSGSREVYVFETDEESGIARATAELLHPP